MYYENPILIVEDSPADYNITRSALAKGDTEVTVFHCDTADEAYEFLFNKGEYEDSSTFPKPSIILLDLNLPGMDGFELLKIIKEDKQLKTVPVIIVTTSENPDHVNKSYYLGANSYINKSMDLDVFMRTIEQIKAYWLETVALAKTE